MNPEISSTDWSTSYSQYLARSVALSARTLSLYQLALERVSQGKLTPTIFQDHFPAFMVAHAGEITTRLAEVGSRFLSDFVRISSSFSQQVPEMAEGERELVPPQFDATNPARWYEQIAEYMGQLNARAIKAYRSQLDHVAAGETTPSEAQQHTAEQMAQRLPVYMQMMTGIYFDLLNGLNDVRSAYEETYFRDILARYESDDHEPTVVVMLSGPAGTTATASLSITNTTRERARIAYDILDVRRADGVGPSVAPAITFVPETLELEPGKEETLTLSLQLEPERYDLQALYSGTLLLTGAADAPLRVELRILCTATSSKPSNG